MSKLAIATELGDENDVSNLYLFNQTNKFLREICTRRTATCLEATPKSCLVLAAQVPAVSGRYKVQLYFLSKETMPELFKPDLVFIDAGVAELALGAHNPA
jgi:hypothetical protein